MGSAVITAVRFCFNPVVSLDNRRNSITGKSFREICRSAVEVNVQEMTDGYSFCVFVCGRNGSAGVRLACI